MAEMVTILAVALGGIVPSPTNHLKTNNVGFTPLTHYLVFMENP